MLPATPRQPRGVAFVGLASSTPLPCDRCPGRSLNLCKPLDEPRLRQLLALGTTRHWKRHEILFRAGDPASTFFKIRKGLVAVSRTLDDGRRQIVALRTAGDCVGYLDDAGRYAFEGQALTDIEACSFDRRRFDAVAADNPDLAAALSGALSSALSQLGEAMLVVGKLRSTERVAHFFAEMASLHRQVNPERGPLLLHMNRSEIADYLGLTVETVSRSIGKLKKRSVIGLIESDEVIVLDDAMLREIGKVSGEPRSSAVG
ncbi:Crp/Fnr family transcriptional regulator [Reyranella sp.]|uniref:Crp/Fnr family transcriptional regulator n=1 Tax=Reyranella sp. TaxID=1929291 RepID=UPI001219A21B|nr:Crp/Fnr family transcriptional regulator [Reyranella sp.]TAJ87348.1 MAG: Crp/Fnr family transcriptional regulator [Reyranella sp.]